MSKVKDKKFNTCFLKVSPYLKCFLERKYGSPVQFPLRTKYYTLMNNYLIDDPNFKRLSYFSYSHAAFNMADCQKKFTVSVELLPDTEKDKFVEIVMPEEIYRVSGCVVPSSTYELTTTGAKIIRAEIKREFWIDFSRFHEECMFRANRMGEAVTSEEIMSDFMVMYDIEVGSLENLMRYWRRWRNQMSDEIKEKRENIERDLDISLEYTP